MKMTKKDGMGRETGEMEMVEFTPPDDLRLDGESGEAMINWTMTPEGRLRITAIEGVSLGGSEIEEEDDVKETMARGIDDMEEDYV